MALTLDDRTLATTDEGFLCDTDAWDSVVAEQLASIEDIDLTDQHWEIINFIRQYYLSYKHLPNARVFTKAIRNTLGEAKGNSRYLHRLFPQGPLKYASKLAGLPKPPTCL